MHSKLAQTQSKTLRHNNRYAALARCTANNDECCILADGTAVESVDQND